MHTFDRIACSLLLTGATLLAQAPRPLDPPIAVPAGCGLHTDDDGHPFGIGAAWQVRFLADRFEWKPALGKAAPHDLPLTMAVTHIGRGELLPVGPAVREPGALRVDYVRAELRERLDIRLEGLKQSFVFDHLPAGRGDLVVRAAITTELQPDRAVSDGAIAFTLPGAGGLQIGQVVGIDANGHSATGSLRTNGSTLEFVLPAAFVDTAALPLVLDPLITPVVVVSTNAADERQVDIAHLGPPHDMHAVVHLRVLSATNTDAYCTFVSTTGVVNSTFGIENFINVSADAPRVVASEATGHYLAVWNENGNVSGRFLQPNGGGSIVTLANSANVEGRVTAAGSLQSGIGRVYVAWLDSTADAIKGCEVDITTNPPAKLTTQTFLTDTSTFTQLGAPTLPRDGSPASLLMTYTVSSSVTGNDGVRGLFFIPATPVSLFGPTFAIAGGASSSAFGQAVAGDGRSWLVAYRTNSTIAGNGAACVAIHQNGTTPVLSTPRSLVTLGTTITDLDAAWFRDSAVLAVARANGAANDVLLMSLDPLTCADCEGTLVVDTGGNDASVALTRTVGTGSADNGAVAWVPISGAQGNLSMQRYAANGGTVTQVAEGPFGDSCVSGCARVGHANFGVELHGGTPAAATFALFATDRIDAPCGTNTIVPDFLNGFVVSLGNTSAAGVARMAFNIPNNAALSGFVFYVQFAKAGSTCFGAFDLSSALQITLQ